MGPGYQHAGWAVNATTKARYGQNAQFVACRAVLNRESLSRMSPTSITLPKSTLSRLWLAMIGQRTNRIECPMETDMKGRFALVTGATRGVGRETARGLLQRGIQTILTARDFGKLEQLKREFLKEGFPESLLHGACLDLSDLDSLRDIETQLSKILQGGKISILIENAGVWPKRFETSKQGYEIAFATNVLGHFVLRKRLLSAQLLATDARIVIVTGDIYILEKESRWDLKYQNAQGGMKAYCQSKLGNIWVAKELQRQYPEMTVAVVHPGVIASELVNSGKVGAVFKSLLMIDTAQGAQMSLYCATQNDIARGGYYHNAVGLAEFPKGDPAAHIEASVAYFASIDRLAGAAS